MTAENPRRLGLGTLALHAGQEPDPATTARAVPIYATSSYVFNDTEHAANLFALKEFGNIYSRLMNPTNDVLEKRLAALDGGAAGLAFASGQAAITAALLTVTHSGQNFISATSLYGGTWTLFTQTLPKLGVEVRFFDPHQPEKIKELADANTRAVYFESLGNPKNDVPDFRRITEVAHALGLPVLCDNTVTPLLLRPIEHGVDIVIYSTTKFIGGHGVHIGGAIVDSGKFPWAQHPQKWPEFCAPDPAYHGIVFEEALRPIGNIAYILHIRTHWLRDTGACMSPFAAFLFLLGLEPCTSASNATAPNAQQVAEFLQQHAAVEWVNYPGLPSHPDHESAKRYLPNGKGAIVGFGIKGGREAGSKFINSVKLASHLANIGDAKTAGDSPGVDDALAAHRSGATGNRRESGIRPHLGRHRGHAADIIADIDQALRASQG